MFTYMMFCISRGNIFTVIICFCISRSNMYCYYMKFLPGTYTLTHYTMLVQYMYLSLTIVTSNGGWTVGPQSR